MATKFLEPGGDADFLVGTTNGFWTSKTNTPTIATDFIHGNHIKSIKTANGTALTGMQKDSIAADSGTRISFYLYIATLPGNNESLMILKNGSTACVNLRITSGGVLQLWKAATSQIGTNGATLSTGTWYRISLAYTITSTTVNRFELFLDGISSISITNATITTTGTANIQWGTLNNLGKYRWSDFYVDDSSALTDTGNIWVTAKRPKSNGTTNGFTTQIGAGGSGSGTGHAPQVNERPLSTTNGWSMVGAGSAVTEEYNIQTTAIGDIDVSTATIIDWVGWASMSTLAGETVNMILDGVNFSQVITSTVTLYTKVKGSSTYPSGTGTDIGIQTDTSLTTVSLYECGIIVSYIPAVPTTSFATKLLLMGVGRN